MATRRRRRARRTGNWFTRHWKALLVALVAIILIVVLAVVKPFSGLSDLFGGNNNQVAGQAGVVTLDGNNVGVFDTQHEAELNKVTVNVGTSTLKISGNGERVANASVSGIPTGALVKQSDGVYTLNTNGFGDGTTILVKILVGGDGSFIGQRLSGNVDTHFMAISVSNPQQPQTGDPAAQTAQTLGLPNGTVYIDGTAFQTYGSEWEAQQAVAGKQNQFTLPRSMVANGLPITVTPNTDDTARVYIRVTMVNAEDDNDLSVCANPQTNWMATLDVSKYGGQQITLMIKAENGWAIANGYSYISFFLPEVEEPAVG